ncbi:phosducin family protein [Botrytis cinerea]
MAAPMDQRINVPIDDPNADTEWNDILRAKGIIPEKPPSPTPLIEEAILEGRRLAHENRLEGKDLDELDALEDEEDEAFLEQYKKQRMAELSSISKKAKHGAVYPLSKPDYQREVTDASQDSPVLVNLTSGLGTNVESRVLTELWRRAAVEFGEVKFCEMRGDMAIEGYPDRNCPTILVYNKGDIVKQVVTLMTMGGVRVGMAEIDKLLIEIGAIKDNDMRVTKRRRDAEDEEEERQEKGGIRGSKLPMLRVMMTMTGKRRSGITLHSIWSFGAYRKTKDQNLSLFTAIHTRIPILGSTNLMGQFSECSNMSFLLSNYFQW